MDTSGFDNGHARHRSARAEDLDHSGEDRNCVRECGAVFEDALRHRLTERLMRVGSASQREELRTVERELAKGDQTLSRFGLGHLVEACTGAKVFDNLHRVTERDLGKTNRRSARGEIADSRNRATHDATSASLDQHDPIARFTWAKSILLETDVSQAADAPREDAKLVTGAASGSCWKCGHEISRRWHYCPNCGAAHSATLASRMRVVEPEVRMCPCFAWPVRGYDHADAQAKHPDLLVYRGANLDQVVTRREREMLARLRLELGLTHEAAEIERSCASPGLQEYQNQSMQEIVFIDAVIDERERALLDHKADALGLHPELVAQVEHAYLRAARTDV